MPRGEKNKLTNKQRQEIYDLKGTVSGYKVAEKYNVSHTAIYNIWGRKKPTNHPEALKQIRRALERTRGVAMNDQIYEMWISISAILDDALEIE